MQKKFKRVYVEITNVCNFNCSFCPKNNRKKEFMSLKNFEYIANQIVPLTDNVCLHVMGEPLLHENLQDILQVCCKHKLNVNLTTNGFLLHKSKELLSNNSIRKLTISLHSFEANNLNITLKKYLQNVVDSVIFIKNTNKNLFVEFRLWNNNNNNLIAKNSYNEQIINYLKTRFHTDTEINNSQKNYTLAENIFLGFDNIFVWPEQSKSNRSVNKFCYALRTHFAVLVDGTVVPCCLDNNGKLALGNIFEQNINDILNSSLTQKIYIGFSCRTAVVDMCKTCEYANKFSK